MTYFYVCSLANPDEAFYTFRSDNFDYSEGKVVYCDNQSYLITGYQQVPDTNEVYLWVN